MRRHAWLVRHAEEVLHQTAKHIRSPNWAVRHEARRFVTDRGALAPYAQALGEEVSTVQDLVRQRLGIQIGRAHV